jgi:hypothetical protein
MGRATLARSAELLRPGGRLLVRIPITDSWAWREYREHWIGLDPPRHLHLFSPRAFRQMAAEIGLRVVSTEYEGSVYQFCSELYRRGVALSEARRTELESFRNPLNAARAEALNHSREGDMRPSRWKETRHEGHRVGDRCDRRPVMPSRRQRRHRRMMLAVGMIILAIRRPTGTRWAPTCGFRAGALAVSAVLEYDLDARGWTVLSKVRLRRGQLTPNATRRHTFASDANL